MNLRLPAAPAISLPALGEGRAGVLAAVRLLTRLAFAALIVVSPFRARFEVEARSDLPVWSDYTNFQLYWSDVVFLAFLALWGLCLLIDGRKPWLGPAAVRWPVAGLFLAACLSVPLSIDPALSLYNVLRLAGAVALAVYVVNEVDGIKPLIPALVVMLALQAVVGMGQAMSQASLGLHALGEFRLDVNASGTSVVWSGEGPRQLRAYGLTDHPNILGGIVAIALLLVGCIAARARNLWTAPLAVVFATGCAALVLTFSRGAALGMAAGLVVVFALLAYRRHEQALLGWGSLCLAAAILCLTLVKPYGEHWQLRTGFLQSEPTGSTEARSISEREALARATNQIFIDNPLAGVGAGALPSAMKDANPEFGYDYQPAHFVLLTVAAETGLIGAMSYGALMLAPFVMVYWRRRELTPQLIAVTGALAAVTVVGLLDYYTWTFAPGRIWFWLVLGLWVAVYVRRRESAPDA